MQQTYQTRIAPSADALRWLDAFAGHFGRAERSLYAAVAAGRDLMKEKSALMAELGLSARQYNALRMQLQGKIDGTAELLRSRRLDLQSAVRSAQRSVKLLSAKLLEVAAGRRELSPRKLASVKRQLFNKTRRLASVRAKLARVQARLAAPVPGIGFGSRKLFNAQFHLEEAGFESHEQWLAQWRESRSNQFFLVGSGDETGGNQSCKAALQEDGRLRLLLKLPPALVDQGAPAFVQLEDVGFAYGHDNVVAVLQADGPLTYRFCRDAKGWRVLVSTSVDALPVQTAPKALVGCLGVDFNADHLALTRVDRFGNFRGSRRVPLALSHLSSDQRDARLSEALANVLGQAQREGLSVAYEDLDFQAKKKSLRELGLPRYARMLSGLAVSRYRQLLQAKAERAGVQLHCVDPAYTSVAGRIKYAVALGLTVHQAAAGVIARSALDFKSPDERPPRSGTHRVPFKGSVDVLDLPARNRSGSTRKAWAVIARVSAQHCVDASRRHTAPSAGYPTPDGSERRSVPGGP